MNRHRFTTPLLALTLPYALALAACDTDGVESTGNLEVSSLAPSLARPTAATLSARKIASSSEVIGGLRADGQVGDFYLANDQIRVIIQDMTRGAQFNIFGGNIIDADVVRAPGEEGKDLLAEFFVDLNLTHTMEPTSMAVVSDGSDGQEARIRVTGKDFPWPLLPGKDPIDPMPVTINQEYILHPGERYVTIDTTVRNDGKKSLPLVEAELLLVGSSLKMAAGGIEVGELVGRTGYIAMLGSKTIGASYAYLPAKGQMIIPFEDAAQTGAILGGTRLRPGETTTFRRYFVVGDRDAASATDAVFAMQGIRTGQLKGTALDPFGQPVADAELVVADADGKYITTCLTRQDGSFSALLPAGEVSLAIQAAGRLAQTAGPFTISAGKETTAPLSLGPQGHLTFRAVDEQGRPCPVRATVSLDGGETTHWPSALGTESLVLTPGTYTVNLSRGPEYSVGSWRVTVPADGTPVTVPPQSPAVLARVLDTTGWLAGDFHLHQKNSNDSWMLLETRVASLLAEGVEVGVPTDHDHVTDYAPTLASLGLTGMLVTGMGDEVSVVDYGHFNYFPIQIDPLEPDAVQGTQFWFGDDLAPLSASELFYKMRQNPGEEVIQINHPRDGASGYFSMIGYNADSGSGIREPLATDFDALEIKNEVFGEDSVLPDYFSVLNLGLGVAATGNSDAHRGMNQNGYPRTFVRVADDRPEANTIEDVVTAIKGQHTIVSSGLFMDLKAKAGTAVAGPGDTLRPGSSPVQLQARLQCASYTRMNHFVLYANGQAVPLVADGAGFKQASSGATENTLTPALIGGRYEQTLAISVTPSEDTWYIILAWGDANLGVVSGDPALVYNSPVYVDLDGVGFLPPGARAPLGPFPALPRGLQVRPSDCED